MKKTHANCAYGLRTENSVQGECLRLYELNHPAPITNINSSGCQYWEPNYKSKEKIDLTTCYRYVTLK